MDKISKKVSEHDVLIKYLISKIEKTSLLVESTSGHGTKDLTKYIKWISDMQDAGFSSQDITQMKEAAAVQESLQSLATQYEVLKTSLVNVIPESDFDTFEPSIAMCLRSNSYLKLLSDEKIPRYVGYSIISFQNDSIYELSESVSMMFESVSDNAVSLLLYNTETGETLSSFQYIILHASRSLLTVREFVPVMFRIFLDKEANVYSLDICQLEYDLPSTSVKVNTINISQYVDLDYFSITFDGLVSTMSNNWDPTDLYVYTFYMPYLERLIRRTLNSIVNSASNNNLGLASLTKLNAVLPSISIQKNFSITKAQVGNYNGRFLFFTENLDHVVAKTGVKELLYKEWEFEWNGVPGAYSGDSLTYDTKNGALLASNDYIRPGMEVPFDSFLGDGGRYYGANDLLSSYTSITVSLTDEDGSTTEVGGYILHRFVIQPSDWVKFTNTMGICGINNYNNGSFVINRNGTNISYVCTVQSPITSYKITDRMNERFPLGVSAPTIMLSRGYHDSLIALRNQSTDGFDETIPITYTSDDCQVPVMLESKIYIPATQSLALTNVTGSFKCQINGLEVTFPMLSTDATLHGEFGYALTSNWISCGSVNPKYSYTEKFRIRMNYQEDIFSAPLPSISRFKNSLKTYPTNFKGGKFSNNNGGSFLIPVQFPELVSQNDIGFWYVTKTSGEQKLTQMAENGTMWDVYRMWVTENTPTHPYSRVTLAGDSMLPDLIYHGNLIVKPNGMWDNSSMNDVRIYIVGTPQYNDASNLCTTLTLQQSNLQEFGNPGTKPSNNGYIFNTTYSTAYDYSDPVTVHFTKIEVKNSSSLTVGATDEYFSAQWCEFDDDIISLTTKMKYFESLTINFDVGLVPLSISPSISSSDVLFRSLELPSGTYTSNVLTNKMAILQQLQTLFEVTTNLQLTIVKIIDVINNISAQLETIGSAIQDLYERYDHLVAALNNEAEGRSGVLGILGEVFGMIGGILDVIQPEIGIIFTLISLGIGAASSFSQDDITGGIIQVVAGVAVAGIGIIRYGLHSSGDKPYSDTMERIHALPNEYVENVTSKGRPGSRASTSSEHIYMEIDGVTGESSDYALYDNVTIRSNTIQLVDTDTEEVANWKWLKERHLLVQERVSVQGSEGIYQNNITLTGKFSMTESSDINSGFLFGHDNFSLDSYYSSYGSLKQSNQLSIEWIDAVDASSVYDFEVTGNVPLLPGIAEGIRADPNYLSIRRSTKYRPKRLMHPTQRSNKLIQMDLNSNSVYPESYQRPSCLKQLYKILIGTYGRPKQAATDSMFKALDSIILPLTVNKDRFQ